MGTCFFTQLSLLGICAWGHILTFRCCWCAVTVVSVVRRAAFLMAVSVFPAFLSSTPAAGLLARRCEGFSRVCPSCWGCQWGSGYSLRLPWAHSLRPPPRARCQPDLSGCLLGRKQSCILCSGSQSFHFGESPPLKYEWFPPGRKQLPHGFGYNSAVHGPPPLGGRL